MEAGKHSGSLRRGTDAKLYRAMADATVLYEVRPGLTDSNMQAAGIKYFRAKGWTRLYKIKN